MTEWWLVQIINNNIGRNLEDKKINEKRHIFIEFSAYFFYYYFVSWCSNTVFAFKLDLCHHYIPRCCPSHVYMQTQILISLAWLSKRYLLDVISVSAINRCVSTLQLAFNRNMSRIHKDQTRHLLVLSKPFVHRVCCNL